MRKTYPEWIWRSYDARPAWAAEATIEEWASHALATVARGLRPAWFLAELHSHANVSRGSR